MKIPQKLQDHLQFLARVIERKSTHLQDTLGDKLLPVWRSAVSEVPATLADNLDRAERLELIAITHQAAGELFA
jgi:hypothetical protein